LIVSLGVNQQIRYAGVMKLSEKYAVPGKLALLYDFVNSLDRRRYVEHGAPHSGGDELETAPQFHAWLQAHGLSGSPTDEEHRRALELREALRAFLQTSSAECGSPHEGSQKLNKAAMAFPFVVTAEPGDAVTIRPQDDPNGLGRVLAQFLGLAATGELSRLKMCGSEECEWIFFDRSRPGNRRWCSSKRCGNRQKTRAYRERKRALT
jgi:predicted RNA-binding Zn ribbon-like protein